MPSEVLGDEVVAVTVEAGELNLNTEKRTIFLVSYNKQHIEKIY